MAGKTDRTAININSIARQAHVSTTTVSNLINSTEVFPISPETRERILRVMRELNYRPHIGGSLMRRNVPRRPKLGFVFGEECMNPILHTAGNPLVQRFLRELESAIEQELDWELAILRVNDENSRSEWNERLIDVEAVVNFGQLNCLMCDTMVRRNLPLINVYPHTEVRRHGSFAGIPDEFDFVFWRNERQMENIFQHFYARGARRFLFLASCNIKENRPEGFGFDAEAKISGFERALAAHPEATGRVLRPGKPRFYTMACEYHLAREMMLEVREELPEVDAVMCHHDIMAQGAALVLMETGRQVGRDVMVSGEGKFDELRFWHPAITTTSVDSIRLNAEICRLLKLRRTDRISPPETVEIPTIISSNGE